MVPCGISWCVALTDQQFCPIHEKDQALHPAEIGSLEFTEEDVEAAREDGFECGVKEGDAEGYERGVAEND